MTAALRNFYTVGDVAKMLKVNKRSLQNWSIGGKIPDRREKMSGYRIYTKRDIEKIRKIITRERVRSMIRKSIMKDFK
jgi:DNA-binding transcriptional MerR regulator